MELNIKKPEVREKTLKNGLSYPLDEELVMLILGTGTKEMPVEKMAKKIVETIDSTNYENIVEKLLSLKGVGTGKALAVAAALEFGKRKSSHFGAHVKTPEDIIPFVKHYVIKSKEHFLAITLNGGHNIIQIHVVSVGTINRTLIHPREVFGEAIRENAAAIILCHNHPSGNVNPSFDDIETTNTLLEASKIIGIPILDHIIIACDTYFSFMENGLIEEEK
ncbi:MAG: DNA repair protein RadC [Treponema sp.]|nr:DNA repair protein RadC [Treponema sp.]